MRRNWLEGLIVTTSATGRIADQTVRQTITSYHRRGQPFVVKPAIGQQGRGVTMVDATLQDANTSLESLQRTHQSGEEVLVQPWVQSYPLLDKNSGQRIDWNIRALVTAGRLCGAYARYGSWGGAVNMSRGADAVNINEAFEACGLSSSEQAAVHYKIDRVSRRIAKTCGAGYIGLDIIINEQLDPVILEANGEKAGGLYNILKTEAEADNIDAAITAIRAIDNQLFRQRRLWRPTIPRLPLKTAQPPNEIELFHSLRHDKIVSDATFLERTVGLVKELDQVTPDNHPPKNELKLYLEYVAYRKALGKSGESNIDIAIDSPAIALAEAYELATEAGDARIAARLADRLMESHSDDIAELAAFSEYLLDNDEAIAGASPSTIGTLCYFMALANADVAISSLSDKTHRVLINETVRATASEEDPFVSFKAPVITAEPLIKSLERQINCYFADANHDFQAINNLLFEGLLQPTKIDQLIAGVFYDRNTAQPSDENPFIERSIFMSALQIEAPADVIIDTAHKLSEAEVRIGISAFITGRAQQITQEIITVVSKAVYDIVRASDDTLALHRAKAQLRTMIGVKSGLSEIIMLHQLSEDKD